MELFTKKMKLINLIIILLLIASANQLFAQKNINTGPKHTIVLYNLKVEKSKPSSKDIKADVQKNFNRNQYFSTIIPHNLSIKLARLKEYDVQKIKKTAKTLKRPFNKKQLSEYTRYLQDLDPDMIGADYIVTGFCSISEVNKGRDRELTAKIDIINLEGKDSITITEKTIEPKLFLRKSIDNLALKIEKNLNAFKTKNIKRKEEALKQHYLTAGLQSGRTFLFGDWDMLYKNTFYIEPYILFTPFSFIGISANGEYFFDAKSKNPPPAPDTKLSIIAATGNMHFFLRFSRYFDISITGGGGMAWSKISVPIIGEVKSMDPYVTGGVNFNFTYNKFHFNIGSSYKRIFFVENPLHLVTINAGISYSLF